MAELVSGIDTGGDSVIDRPLRECGECYTCCVYLGIEELKKFPGVSCRHLSGASGPKTRCTIYSSRPNACQKYNCFWKKGLGPEEARPDKSGLLVTPYAIDGLPLPHFAATITITNKDKCGRMDDPDSFLHKTIGNLVEMNCMRIRIVNYTTKEVFELGQGKIYLGKLMPTKNYEELSFAKSNTPIGKYEIRENRDG